MWGTCGHFQSVLGPKIVSYFQGWSFQGQRSITNKILIYLFASTFTMRPHQALTDWLQRMSRILTHYCNSHMAKYLRKMCNLESLKCKYFQNIDDFHRWAQPTKVKALATWIVEPLQTLPPYWFVKPQYIDENRKNGSMGDAVPLLNLVEGLQLDCRWL